MNVFRARSDKTVSNPLVLAVNKMFGRYKPEQDYQVRDNDVKRNPNMEKMAKLYLETMGAGLLGCHTQFSMGYYLKDHSYSAKDIEQFSLFLASFQDGYRFSENAAYFLNALIITGKEKNYTIHTTHMYVPFDNLGYENTKNITIEGNVGKSVGRDMKDGIMVVNGDAGDEAGMNMDGGTLVVKGTAGYQAGYDMRGGTIVLEGSAGDRVGWQMKGGKIIVKTHRGAGLFGYQMTGGEIHIEGEIGSSLSSSIKHGKIYHKGKLIVDK
jgi:hypothetical protein